jgi:hypothetical protein
VVGRAGAARLQDAWSVVLDDQDAAGAKRAAPKDGPCSESRPIGPLIRSCHHPAQAVSAASPHRGRYGLVAVAMTAH